MRFILIVVTVLSGVVALMSGCDGGVLTDMDPSAEESTDDAESDAIDPDAGGDDLTEMCTEDAMLVCRQIAPGVFVEFAVGRESPGCKFPEFPDTAPHKYCQGDVLTKITDSLEVYADQAVAVSGSFADWRNEPVPDCAMPEPFSGEPTIDDFYQVPLGGWGIATEDTRLAAVASDTAFLDTIQKDARVTLRGIFRYKPIGGPCGNGSLLHKSGVIELPKEALPLE